MDARKDYKEAVEVSIVSPSSRRGGIHKAVFCLRGEFDRIQHLLCNIDSIQPVGWHPH